MKTRAKILVSEIFCAILSKRAAGVSLLAALLFLSAPSLCLADSTPESDKFTITSAYSINGKWVFRIFDGAKKETSEARLGVRNAKGILVISFDESTGTAQIATDGRVFTVRMAQSAAAAASPSTETIVGGGDKTQKAENAEDKDTSVKVSRRSMLEKMK